MRGENARGGLAAGGCTVKRLTMLCPVDCERRCACGDVPLGCEAETGRRASVNYSGSWLI